MISEDLFFAPVSEIGRLFRTRELSPVGLLDDVLTRQRALEPELNAFITVLEDQARDAARRAEYAFAHGLATGPMTGIPVSIKDLFDIAGVATTAGSRVMRGHVATEDSAVYQRLHDAGSVVIGKTNLHEFAYGIIHPDYGRSNNPWDPSRTASGSSGGSAAAVAAGIGWGSIGTDTGGSLRAPASFCGLVGLKPTAGSVSSVGLVPLSKTLDHIGPLARRVDDCRLTFEALTGRSLPSSSMRRPVIGVVRELLDATPDAQLQAVVLRALDVLTTDGAEVREVSMPEVTKILEQGIAILAAEAAHVHHDWLPDRERDYTPGTVANLMAGAQVSAVAYLSALDARRRFIRTIDSVLAEVDLLAAPTMPHAATEKEVFAKDGDFDLAARTIPFNISGHPAVTLPTEPDKTGLPLGVQLIGAHGGEHDLLAVAQRYESACGGFPTASARLLDRHPGVAGTEQISNLG